MSLPGWLMNPHMKKYWIKCWPSSGVLSLVNFLSGSLVLYSFLHNGPAKAKRMQRIIQDGCHPGSYEFKLHSKQGWCRKMYFIPRQVCCHASYCTGLPSCLPSPHSSLFLWDACPRSALRVLNPHQDYCCIGLFKILPIECFLLVHSVQSISSSCKGWCPAISAENWECQQQHFASLHCLGSLEISVALWITLLGHMPATQTLQTWTG